MNADLLRSPAYWLAFGIVLAILETLLPGFVLLGLGVGALIVSGLLFFSGPSVFDGLAGIAYLAALWATTSLMAWFAIRKVFGFTENSSRRIKQDINEKPYKGDRD